MRGLTFEIPNEYGRHLFNILSEINCKEYIWQTGGEEAYYIENGKLGSSIFPKQYVYQGGAFYNRISKGDQYPIFADLKAFPTAADVQDIATYEEFVKSACVFVLLLVDCSYVTIYAKNEQILKTLYTKAVASNYTAITYITDENDDRTTLTAF